jgi:cysteine-rich repeat protein
MLAVADIGAQTVFRVDPDTGAATPIFTGHDFFGVAVAPFLARGHVYVVGSDRVLQRVDPLTGEQRVMHRGSPFASSMGVAEALDGRILVSNAGSNRGVHQVDRESFAVTDLSPNQNFGVARYTKIDPTTGDAMVCKQSGQVFRVDVETGSQTAINSGASVGWCEGIDVDSGGNLTVVDRSNDRLVRIFASTGQEIPLASVFVNPIDVAHQNDLTVLVTDDGDDTVWAVSLINQARAALTSGQSLGTPRGITVDEIGNVYIADRAGGLIWYDPDGLSFNNQVVIARGSLFDSALGVATALPAVCGDAIKAPDEGCDDGGTVSGDGCSATCELEDADGDGLPDLHETGLYGTDPFDDDTDDDGLTDGFETLGPASGTEALLADTDGDGVQDGTESGLEAPMGTDTDLGVFVPDADPATTTDPLDPDTDGDGLPDGVEDANGNGAVDPGETDPLTAEFPVPALSPPGIVVLAALVGVLAARRLRRADSG